MNCQSLIKKKTTVHELLNDLGTNTIYGLSETWLKADDDETFWNLNSDYFKSYRCDRYLSQKDRGGGVMLFVPKSPNPKSRKDLNCMDACKFERLWIECNLTNDTKKKQKQLINISYNPNKNLTACFLEELSTSIDHAITKDKPITLLGDYNIDYLNDNERECLDSVMIPYGFEILNTAIPTRLRGNSQSPIDYILTDHSKAEHFVPLISDNLFRTTKNKEIDHRATSIVTEIEVKQPPKVFF